MKDRRPRKLKKKAKKLKASDDAIVMMKAAMVSLSGAMQLACVASTPIPAHFNPAMAQIKSIRAAQCAVESAQSIQKVMSEIKPWREFAI
jgi:hypothetical protein